MKINVLRWVLWTVAFSAMSALAADRTWDGGGANALASNPTNWVGDVAPTNGDVVILDGTTNKNMTWDLNREMGSWVQVGYAGTVTVATVYGTTGFTNLSITGDCTISNGVWTHIINPSVNYESNRLSVTIGGNLIVGSNAAIDVTGRGYANSKGPGTGSAGSYGGRGDPGQGSGPCYGSIIAPTNLGSGGSSTWGGGAIRLRVGGIIRNDGLLCANGGPSVYYTGSGGSIYLLAGALTGGGAIQANGGIGSGGYTVGGGGRISLIVTNPGAVFSDFTGVISTYGINSKSSAGTIYLETPANIPGKGELIVNNYGGIIGYGSANTDLSGMEAVTYDFSRITLTNGATLNIGSDDTLILTNTMLVGGGSASKGIWISGGTLLTPAVFVYSNLFIGISATGSTFSPATSLTIGTNAELRADKAHALSGNLTIADGGLLTHTANASTEAYKINLTVNGSVNVQPGGRIDVSTRGYSSGNGPGAGTKGGSYGGRGGGSGVPGGSPVDPTGTHPYGSIVAPTNLGSGGGFSPGGGGAIQMMVSGGISNQGIICADGGCSSYYQGSGGSIYLTAGALTGSGAIRANGGTVTSGEGAGGGGRIALVVTSTGADFSTYTGPITAYRGTNSGTWGGAGTVYLRTAAQGLHEGTLIIDNNAITAYATEISSNVTDTVVGNVLIRNGAYLLLCSNQTLTVGGVWSNTASFEAQWGSQVILAGGTSSTSTVYGTNLFMGLTCTNTGGKTLLFQAGQTNTIAAQGRLTLKGSEIASNLVLRSTSEGTPWKLNVNASAEQSVVDVDVKDSDALIGVGAPVIALNSLDRGGNLNWVFMQAGSGETNLWTGDHNTGWSEGTNWSLGRSPLAEDFVQIPAARPHYPVLDAARTVSGIAIQAGASLALAGYNLTISNNAVVAGTLIASGLETITFCADTDFTGGTFTPAFSTVILAGRDDQMANLANQIFYRVNVANNVGIVIFGNGFSATELRCEAVSGTRNITFQQGDTVSLRDLVLLGSAASTNITLQSSELGLPWRLAVSGYRSVRGVNVQDSDASAGLPIPASFSMNGGNNTNWVFVAPSVWLGTNNIYFHTASNWSPAGVPDANTRVQVDGANPMTITGAVTVLGLIVGGGSQAATVTVNSALTVAEQIVVSTNGTLILNQPCTVSNSLFVLGGGTLTHSANAATEQNKLNVTVLGNLTVDSGGAVDVTGKGFTLGKGPGGANAGSYGGRGDALQGSGPCYGSIVAATNLGSGGSSTAGGGGILLMVAGTLCNEGLLCADGAQSAFYTGSGGGIFLFTGVMTGGGTIRANGGMSTGGQCAGGGGRVALVVTNAGADFSGYTGPIQVFGGTRLLGTSCNAGAGTIYQQRASDRVGRGTIWLDNKGNSGGYTDFPPSTNYVAGEVDRATLNVTNVAAMRLANDFSVGDIWLQSANTVLDLNFKTLIVHSRQHALSGTVTNFGAITWMPDVAGTVFSIR